MIVFAEKDHMAEKCTTNQRSLKWIGVMHQKNAIKWFAHCFGDFWFNEFSRQFRKMVDLSLKQAILVHLFVRCTQNWKVA